MHVPRLLTLAFSMAAVILPASVAHAQAASTLPAPLVAALLAGHDHAVPDSFYVGGLPPGWPASLTPPGASVIGGTFRRGALVAVFADTAPDALDRYRALLAKAGWTRPSAPAESGSHSAQRPITFFCHDSARIEPLLVSNRQRATNLYVSLHPSTKGTCGATLSKPGARTLERQGEMLPQAAPPTATAILPQRTQRN